MSIFWYGWERFLLGLPISIVCGVSVWFFIRWMERRKSKKPATIYADSQSDSLVRVDVGSIILSRLDNMLAVSLQHVDFISSGIERYLVYACTLELAEGYVVHPLHHLGLSQLTSDGIVPLWDDTLPTTFIVLPHCTMIGSLRFLDRNPFPPAAHLQATLVITELNGAERRFAFHSPRVRVGKGIPSNWQV